MRIGEKGRPCFQVRELENSQIVRHWLLVHGRSKVTYRYNLVGLMSFLVESEDRTTQVCVS